MENEQHHYELRSRSRSRSHTPLIRSLAEPEVTEHHYDLRSKSRERSHTPGEVTSSRRSGSRSLTGSGSKVLDKSMETIEENKEGSVTESMTDNQSTKSEGSGVTTRKAERRSERQRAKRQIFVNGQSESKENVSNQKAEQKRKSVTPHRILTSDYSSEEGEREDPPSRPESAYEIYKQAGEWWNVFPKTDYTYSQTSQCRYEIAPGVLAMPNMSRRSIHADDNESSIVPQVSYEKLSQTSQGTTESGISDMDTVDFKQKSSLSYPFDNDHDMSYVPNSSAKTTLYKKTHIEQYKSHKEVIYSQPGYSSDFSTRYLSWSNTPSRFIGKYKAADSDTELDETLTSSSVQTNQRWKIVQWLTYFTTFITIWFKKTVEFFKFKKRQHYYGAQTYRSYNESKWSALWQALDYYTHNTYFFFVRMLVLDTWLLSQFTGVRKWLQEKNSRILWITLLPLLLLFGGWCLVQCFSLLSDIKTVPQTMTEKLLIDIQQDDKSRNVEEKLINKEIHTNDLVDKADLGSRIKLLENKQTNQMEYLINITRVLEDQKQKDADFQKEYNDKIINLENKLDVELNNVMYNELKVIKYEFEKLRELYSEFKSCCNTNAEFITNHDLEKHVERILFSYLPGYSKEDLVKISQNLLASYNREDQTVSNNDVGNANVRVSDEQIRKIAKEVLQIYDADKTGQVDYALESAGGHIVSTRCTQRYDIKSRAFTLFGFTLYYESNNPRTVIQRNPIQPGVCWAFQDFPGYLLIQLRSAIYVTGFTLEHVSKLILSNENMSSAPKKFNVWGLTNENDPEPVMFGDYEFTYFDDNLQYFPVQNAAINRPYEYVELRIHSNHGQLDYTCLYRFRVHGRPA
ncbi:Protein unc-84-like protein A [Camponotus japonicus]